MNKQKTWNENEVDWQTWYKGNRDQLQELPDNLKGWYGEEKDMRVSPTLAHIALHGIGNEWFVTLLEKCDEQGFDLDDFMFEIWRDTQDEY